MFGIATTDNTWTEVLNSFNLRSKVNFWTPTPWNIKSLNRGDRLYFMLKAPIRKIGGFGEFDEYANLTIDEAWNEFGHRNGRISKDEFIKSIQKYINKNSSKVGGIPIEPVDYKIGCIILNNCQFWSESEYLDVNDFNIAFANQVVTWKSFNSEDPFKHEFNHPFKLITANRPLLTSIVNSRIGQGRFKGEVLKAYDNRCCITRSTIPEILEAAHIQPYISKDSNHIQNGLLLRSDIHRLFDNNLICIDANYRIVVSHQIPEYQYLHRQILNLPRYQNQFPSQEALANHMNDFRDLDKIS